MPGKPGAGTKNVGINMPLKMIERLDALAGRSGISRSEYVKRLIDRAMARDTHWRTTLVEEAPQSSSPENEAKVDRLMQRAAQEKTARKAAYKRPRKQK